MAPPLPGGVRGHGLRRLRWSTRLSATAIARELGVGTSTVYNWEWGRARVPLERLEPLALLCGIERPNLLDELLAAPVTPLRRLRPPSPLRTLRLRSGLSPEHAVRRVGIHRHTLSAWERGDGRPPLAALRRLALDRRHWRPGDHLPLLMRALRQWAGLTQAGLAARCGCGVATVRSWERGRAAPRCAAASNSYSARRRHLVKAIR